MHTHIYICWILNSLTNTHSHTFSPLTYWNTSRRCFCAYPFCSKLLSRLFLESACESKNLMKSPEFYPRTEGERLCCQGSIIQVRRKRIWMQDLHSLSLPSLSIVPKWPSKKLSLNLNDTTWATWLQWIICASNTWVQNTNYFVTLLIFNETLLFVAVKKLKQFKKINNFLNFVAESFEIFFSRGMIISVKKPHLAKPS